MWRWNWDTIELFGGKPALRAIVDPVPVLHKDSEGDPVISEWKNRFMDCALCCRFPPERRENPHPTPAPLSLLKQDFLSPKNEGMIFGEMLGPKSASSDRQRFRLFGATKSLDRANRAFWPA
jgi:hypothetical protein